MDWRASKRLAGIWDEDRKEGKRIERIERSILWRCDPPRQGSGRTDTDGTSGDSWSERSNDGQSMGARLEPAIGSGSAADRRLESDVPGTDSQRKTKIVVALLTGLDRRR